MALSTTTGNPPAVTLEHIEAWTKIADDVTAALTMGGQQGLDFLVNIMAEWCEAVDDVNSARQICVDLAERGLRHEAIRWHAPGFFDVADRLDPARPGWEDWETALAQREIVTPRVDGELKEMANRIHEDLKAVDLSGQSLEDYLVQLRRNILLRGHLGERLVILESIRGLDPSGEAWSEMISPIRRRRVDTIADEVRAAIARRDFETLGALRAEVASQDWGGELPATVSALLDSTTQCAALDDLRSQLSQAAALLVGRVEEARRQPYGAPGQTALTEATLARKRYADLRTSLVLAMQAAAATPEALAIVAESGVKEVLRKLDGAVHDPSAWLDQQAEVARARALAGDIEAAVLRQIETAPARSSNLETFGHQLRMWRGRADNCLEQARKQAARLPGGVPASTNDVIQRLRDTIEQLNAHTKALKRREKQILLYFLIGFGVFAMLVVTAIVAVMAIW